MAGKLQAFFAIFYLAVFSGAFKQTVQGKLFERSAFLDNFRCFCLAENKFSAVFCREGMN